MDKTLLKKLLKKYSRGKCSPHEEAIINSWLATLHGDDHQVQNEFQNQRLADVKINIDGFLHQQAYRTRRRPAYWLSAAAVILLAGYIGLYPLYIRQTDLPQTKAKTERFVKNGWVFIATPRGVTRKFNLPDGSTISVDASTRIHYPVKFINHLRPVYLDEGQALFNVAKDPQSPFTVYTGKFATTALGTAFNIRSYAAENKISISLIHGKIRVDDLQKASKKIAPAVLTPHQQLVLVKSSGRVIQSVFKDEAPVLSWTTGVLYFKDASSDEVINVIQNRFNVTIINHSRQVTWSYTGTFKNEPLPDILKTICLTESITYTINKQTITLN